MTNEEAGDARFVPVVRPLGGLPYIYHGYVFDRKTAKMVASCSHRHTRRRQPHGFYTSGSVFAERCATTPDELRRALEVQAAIYTGMAHLDANKKVIFRATSPEAAPSLERNRFSPSVLKTIRSYASAGNFDHAIGLLQDQFHDIKDRPEAHASLIELTESFLNDYTRSADWATNVRILARLWQVALDVRPNDRRLQEQAYRFGSRLTDGILMSAGMDFLEKILLPKVKGAPLEAKALMTLAKRWVFSGRDREKGFQITRDVIARFPAHTHEVVDARMLSRDYLPVAELALDPDFPDNFPEENRDRVVSMVAGAQQRAAERFKDDPAKLKEIAKRFKDHKLGAIAAMRLAEIEPVAASQPADWRADLKNTLASALETAPETPNIARGQLVRIAYLSREERGVYVTSLLIESLPHDNWKTARLIVNALGYVHENKDAARQALEHVLLGDSEPDVRAEAAASLGRLRDPDAVPVLVATIRKSTQGGVSTTIIQRCLTALGRIGERPGCEALLRLLADPHWTDDRRTLILNAVMNPAMTESLFELATASDPDVLPHALTVLTEVASALPDDHDFQARSRKIMLAHLDDDSPLVRAAAATALGSLGLAADLPRLQALTKDPYSQTPVSPALLIETDPRYPVREAAHKSLATLRNRLAQSQPPD